MPINYWHNWSRNILRKSLKVSWEVMAWIAKLTRKNKFIWTTTIPLVVRRANLCDDPTEGTSSNHFGNTQNKRLLQHNLSPLTCNHTKPHADMHIAFFFVVFFFQWLLFTLLHLGHKNSMPMSSHQTKSQSAGFWLSDSPFVATVQLFLSPPIIHMDKTWQDYATMRSSFYQLTDWPHLEPPSDHSGESSQLVRLTS